MLLWGKQANHKTLPSQFPGMGKAEVGMTKKCYFMIENMQLNFANYLLFIHEYAIIIVGICPRRKN